MTCRRAFDVDLAAFLRAPRAPELADFVEHYPRCPDCAAEVRAWTEVHLALADPHPAPADLLAHHDGTLAGEGRASVDRHLATCPSCAEELRALRRYDAVGRDDAVPGAAAPAPTSARRGTLGRVGRALWHPAVAYAVALLLLVPVALQRRWEQVAPVDPGQSVAQRERAAPARTAAPEAAKAAPEPAPAPALRRGAEAPQDAGAPPPRPDTQTLDLTHAAPRAAAERDAVARPAPAARAGARQAPSFDADARRLTIPVADAARGAPTLEVRLRDAPGARELRQRLAAPPPGAPVSVELPAGWVTPGRWEIELHAAGEVTRFTLDVP